MEEITCKCGCGKKKSVRSADRRRGWGLYFSKSCKAVDQARKMGRPNSGSGSPCRRDYFDTFDEYLDDIHPFSSEGHGQE